jgi:hypothetical protein
VPQIAGSGRAFEKRNVADRDLSDRSTSLSTSEIRLGRLSTSTTFVSLTHEICRRVVVVR